MASIFQPGDDQTFLFKSYPSGQQYECHLTAHEILQIAKTIDPTFDSVALLAYASSTFGYWIFPFTLGSPNTVNFRDIGVLPSGYDGNYIAIDKDVSSYNIAYIISDDGTTLDGRLGTNGWDTIYVSELSSNYWFKVFSNDNYPNVLYTESNYGKLYINGSEYRPPIATLRVNYYLPDSDYEYTKLTYKKNEKPESVNDGTIVNINPSNSYVDIPKFAEGDSYYFKIFTSKSESEAFPYTVGPILSSWQNVPLPCVTGTSSNDDIWTTWYDDWVSNLPDGITLAYLPPETFNIPRGSTAWLFGDSSWGIMISCGSASDIQMVRWFNGSIVTQTEHFADKSWITSGVYKISILAGKNNTENKGSIPWIINYNDGQSYFISAMGFNDLQTYNWLNQST